MLTDRAFKILEAAVQGFIDTGEPVSSGWLFERHNFGIRPAMIRHELETLSDEGFLEQPHHSAGRVPTDKGYEFFADKIIETEKGTAQSVEKLVKLLKKRAFADFLGEFSNDSGLAGATRAENDTHKGGIENLVGGFEWDTADEIKSVMRDFAALDERMKNMTNKFFAGEPQVFIGKKSPITRSECLAVVLGEYDSGGGRISFVAIGPKRMNYKKTLKVFKGLNNAGRK